MNVNWVACGKCYSKTEGTELGGIELIKELKLDFPRSNAGLANPKTKKKKAQESNRYSR